jgi:hypothetical protein
MVQFRALTLRARLEVRCANPAEFFVRNRSLGLLKYMTRGADLMFLLTTQPCPTMSPHWRTLMTFATQCSRRFWGAFGVLALAMIVAAPLAARGDIFEWEYIDPADPSQGKRASTTLVLGGAGVDAVPGAYLANRDLTKAYLTGKDHTQAYFPGAKLTGADTRGAYLSIPAGAITEHLIGPNGRVLGLDLSAREQLVVRDCDGAYVNSPLVPVQVTDHFAMADGGVLELVFEADAWDSITSFAAGIPVELDGVLELWFASGVDLASQVGRTFQLFNWAGVTAVGLFDTVQSEYIWNLSRLYASGDGARADPGGLLDAPPDR